VAALALREYLSLLHLPTTSCILSFAIIGGTIAPVVHLDRLLLVLLQLFLVGGVAANYLDEIQGRPWHTTIPEANLWIIGFAALAISSMLGIYIALTTVWWFLLFVAVWGFVTVAYDLELFNGRLHNTVSLALGGGSICLGSYCLQSLTITPQVLVIAIIVCCIAGQGRNIYEAAKPVCKDNIRSPHETSRFAWALLKTLILFVNIVAITSLTYRILA